MRYNKTTLVRCALAARLLTGVANTLPSPALVLGFLFATLYGAAFHLLLGGDARRLASFLIAGWLGFTIGQVAGSVLNVTLFDIGLLHLFPATIGALFALLIAHLLTNRPANADPLVAD